MYEHFRHSHKAGTHSYYGFARDPILFRIIPAVERKSSCDQGRDPSQYSPAGGTFLIGELRVVNWVCTPPAFSINIVRSDSCPGWNDKMRLTLNRFNIGFPCAIAFFRRLKMSFTWSLF
jgi:hypothetical protein